MNKVKIIVLTALVPCVWGSTFIVTTELLSDSEAFTNAAVRALMAGALLLAITRELPRREWLWKIAVAGALNFSIFWFLLFVAAYRLPGGVAATVGAVQPLLVYMLATGLLQARMDKRTYVAACFGILGVGMLAITPDARIDPVGVLAAVGGAFAMAMGVVLTKRWQMPVSPLSFASWQLIVGGLILAPAALIFETPFAVVSIESLFGYLFLGIIGGAITYAIWFKGISRLGPVIPTTLGFFSPLTAILLGWVVLDQTLTSTQMVGAVAVLASVIAAVWLQNGIGHADGSVAQRPCRRIPRRYLIDPLSQPDLQNMTARELADLPICRRRIHPE